MFTEDPLDQFPTRQLCMAKSNPKPTQALFSFFGPCCFPSVVSWRGPFEHFRLFPDPLLYQDAVPRQTPFTSFVSPRIAEIKTVVSAVGDQRESIDQP